jgi:AFG3 family protein
MIDEEVRLLVDTAYKRTLALVTEKKHLVEAMAQGLLDKEVLQRHDLVKLLGDRPFVSENPQNIDILNEGFKMHYPKAATTPDDEPAETDEPEDDEPSPAFPLAT